MPWPRQAAFAGGTVRVACGDVTWLGTDSPRLCAEVDRLRTQLPALSIDCATTAPAYPQLGDEESYRLEVAATGSVRLDAPTEWGVLRGLATLVQLGRAGASDIELPVVIIEDAPRFPWRGLMVDVVRHFLSIGTLHRTLEAMAFVKLNVLHLHLTDDQGFRFPSTAYPKLPEIGGRGEFYRVAELEGLVERAAGLGIRVIPELDVPGHVTSWLTAYPEFASRDTPMQPSERFGVHEAALDPANEFLYPALETLFREVAAIFPDAFLHIGGDEVEGSWWRDSLPIRRFMKDQAIPDNAGLHAHFNQRLSKQLRWLRRRVIGWDEVIDPALSDRVVIQSWRGARSRDRALAQGFDCVFSAGYYLDLFYPADIHYRFDPEATSEELDATEQAMIDDSRLAHVRNGLQCSRRFAEKSGKVDQSDGRVTGLVLG
jgi:hexosaminidase